MKQRSLFFLMGTTCITVKFLYYDHLWDCPKVVFKTTFGQSQGWSLIRGTLGVENEIITKNLQIRFLIDKMS